MVRELARPVVAVVFARGGSKGVPRKNLRPVGGVPLVARAVLAARACPEVDRVVVSTDDDEIAGVARQAGAEVPWMRPAELASDSAPEWASWQHAIRALQDAGAGPGTFVSVPPTAPLREPHDISGALRTFAERDVDAVVTATPARRHPTFNMVTVDEHGHAVLADPSGTQVRRQDAPPLYDLTTVAYVADPAYVLDALRLLAGRVAVHVVAERNGWDVDTEFDLAVADLLAGGDR